MTATRSENCGKGGFNPNLQRGDRLARQNFRVGQNFGNGQQWKYLLPVRPRTCRTADRPAVLRQHDWYREGAEELVHDQDQLSGFWQGRLFETRPVVATSFALLFLAKGRAPVLINKLRHGPQNDWDNDTDDVRNLVAEVSRDWKTLLTWQVINPEIAAVEDLLQAPILFFNGHEVPEMSAKGRENLRYLHRAGRLHPGRGLLRPVRVRPRLPRLGQSPVSRVRNYQLHPLAEDHAIWRAKHRLLPDVHPLWGIEYGCRTVLVYSPSDLSCYWNQAESRPANPAVIKALKVGQNIVDYATGRELPADKLAVREVRELAVRAASAGSACRLPSCGMPATGTSRRWRFPA